MTKCIFDPFPKNKKKTKLAAVTYSQNGGETATFAFQITCFVDRKNFSKHHKFSFSSIHLHQYMHIKNITLKFRETGLARKSANDRFADFLPTAAGILRNLFTRKIIKVALYGLI